MNGIKQRASMAFAVIAVLASAALFYFLSRFESTIDSMVGGVLEICAIMLAGIGGAKLLWTVEKSLRGLGGPLLLLIGLFVMVVAAMSAQIIFVIVGGFAAVLGGMFLLLKK